MHPELVMLEGDNENEDIYMSPMELKLLSRYHPELMGQVVTGAKVGALVAKGFQRLFKRVGKKRRGRVDKWKKKIRAKRAKKLEQQREQLRLQQMTQTYQDQYAAPGQTMNIQNLQKFAIPALIGVGLLMALKK